MKNIKKYLIALSVLTILISPSFSSAATVEELQAQIAALLAQIQQLQAQLAQLHGPAPVWCHDFNVNLKIGDRSAEVDALHIALQKSGFSIDAHELAGHVADNGDFGELTASAVTGFQQKYKDEILTPWGLQYGTGFVGKTTRAKLNKLYGCGIECPLYSLPLCKEGEKIVSGGYAANGCALPGKCVPVSVDGTLYGQCSVNKPKFCDEGNLVDRCSICGCPLNYSCDLIFGSCKKEEVKEEYCPYPLCDTTSKNYDLTASNNPKDYVGDRIAYELYSDWKNYQPLKNKVNELIQGKTNDYDKLVTIANWVKHSKTYGEPSPANKFKTVSDIFNSNTGVCLDASILLTAMLRLAEIPSRSVTHAFVFHNFNEVYINNNWVQVDATFGGGDAYIQDLTADPVDPAFIFEYYNHFNNIKDKFRGVTYSDIYFYKRESIESDVAKSRGIKYGKLILPLNAKTLFYDEGRLEVVGAIQKEGLQPVWMMYRFEVMDNKCLEEVNISDFKGLGAFDFYYWAVDAGGEHWTGVPRITGYQLVKIPACKYRIHYYYSMFGLNYNQNQLAYADFEIKTERQVVQINPDSLVKIAGGNQNSFNILVNTLKEIK